MNSVVKVRSANTKETWPNDAMPTDQIKSVRFDIIDWDVFNLAEIAHKNVRSSFQFS